MRVRASAIAAATFGAMLLLTTAPASTQASAVANPVTLASDATAYQRASAAAQRVTIDARDAAIESILSEISRQAMVQIIYSTSVVPVHRRVSLRMVDVPVMDAVRAILDGTDIGAELAPGGEILLVRRAARGTELQVGVVTGRVTDAASGEAIEGATVLVLGTGAGAISGAYGRYRIERAPAGSQTLEVRRLGYARTTKPVDVRDGQETTVDFALAATANVLSSIVVTGTVVGTERKQLPNPITVIGSDEIERKNVVKVDQLLRGSAPGIMAWNQGPIDYYAQFGSIRGASTFGFNAFKVYIDGVEMAEPRDINTIDPQSIDHIEIVRGPQASTLYGSQALAGVMQIFTKTGRSTARPIVSGKVAFGMIDTKWVDATPLSQDYSLAVSGGQENFNYNFGGTHYRVGAYLPEASTSNSSAFGSLHGSQGPLSMDFSGRYYLKSFDWPLNPILRDAGYVGWSKPLNEHHDLVQQTYGLRLNYVASAKWQHNLTLGYDQTTAGQYNREPRFTTPADSFMRVDHGGPSKASIAYNTTLQLALSPTVSSTITAGADHWRVQDGGYTILRALNNDGTIVTEPGGPMANWRMQYDNSGVFTQVMLGFRDAFFLTGGIRGEKSDNFGADYGMSWAPRVGGSYVHDFGAATIKARASYGRAIKPPEPTAGEGSSRGNLVFLANADLAPEKQTGYDAGLELYLGHSTALQVTYYDQTAVDLIDLVQFPPAEPGFLYYKWENVGRIKNKGWEFQGDFNWSPVTLRLTYSVTDSRVRRLSPTYTGELVPGDKMLEVPYTSGGATLGYTLPNSKTNVQFGATYIGHQTNTDYIALYGLYYGGEPYRGSLRDYWMEYPSVVKYNLSVTHSFNEHLNAFVQADNLTSNLKAERDNTLAQQGRWTVVGLRFRY